MRTGLFGKLPAKRDFVALAAPRGFLTVWERWLQGGVSASRQELGSAWQEAFLRAPIWRFWLGAELAGAPVLGAFMPSVDGVGRYFPLSVFAAAEEGDTLPPPELAPQEEWFGAAEAVLLGALARRAGEPVSREALAEEAHMSGNVRTVDVQMTRLRRKIERDPRFPRYLHTVRGTGYVLKPD